MQRRLIRTCTDIISTGCGCESKLVDGFLYVLLLANQACFYPTRAYPSYTRSLGSFVIQCMARPGSGHVKPLLHHGDTTTLPRLRILPVVDPGPRTAREPTIATVNATMTEKAIETREETVKGRVLRPLVARVDVTNAMAILRTREVDGSTEGIETERRDMSIGREIGGMGRESILLTDNTRGYSGL